MQQFLLMSTRKKNSATISCRIQEEHFYILSALNYGVISPDLLCLIMGFYFSFSIITVILLSKLLNMLKSDVILPILRRLPL